MNNFDNITQQLDEVTGGSYWARMHYARAAWAGAYGYPMFAPMGPRLPYYPGAFGPGFSPRAQWRAYAAWSRGLWG